MLIEFSIVPIGRGESMGDELARVMRLVDESGLPYKAGPMGTVVEGRWDEIMTLVRRCHEEVLATSPRAITTIKIDDRPSKPMDRMEEKLKSVERRLGRELRK